MSKKRIAATIEPQNPGSSGAADFLDYLATHGPGKLSAFPPRAGAPRRLRFPGRVQGWVDVAKVITPADRPSLLASGAAVKLDGSIESADWAVGLYGMATGGLGRWPLPSGGPRPDRGR